MPGAEPWSSGSRCASAGGPPVPARPPPPRARARARTLPPPPPAWEGAPAPPPARPAEARDPGGAMLPPNAPLVGGRLEEAVGEGGDDNRGGRGMVGGGKGAG